MEPIILELEREENDLLIIAHESVLRVLYGYLMACSAADIPKLDFPRDEIIEVTPPHPHSQSVLTILDHPVELSQPREAHQDPWAPRVDGGWVANGYPDPSTTKRCSESIPWDTAGAWNTPSGRHSRNLYPSGRSSATTTFEEDSY